MPQILQSFSTQFLGVQYTKEEDSDRVHHLEAAPISDVSSVPPSPIPTPSFTP